MNAGKSPLFALFLLIFSVPEQAISQPVDSARILRVLTYNIYHGETMKGDFDLDLIAEVIRSVNPDLVALQEVDFRTARARGLDLAAELGYRTGLIPLFGRAMDYDGGEYGEAILSRYTFTRTLNVLLSASEGHEPRAALEATVRLPSGDTIAFVGTHLDHTRDAADRIRQAIELNRYFSRNPHPTILAGDLNALPDSEPMQILFSRWTPAYEGVADPTYPSHEPVKKIDYILFTPGASWRVLEQRPICDKLASDHCAYLAVLELLPD